MNDKRIVGRLSLVAGNVEEEIGMVYSHLHEAIESLKNSLYQPAHFDCQPTDKMMIDENRYRESCEEAEKETKRLASEIYLALTGESPV